MTVNDFVSAVNRNASRVTSYKHGGDGNDGTCDCIGLIIGAARLCGEKWTGTHGSNYAARNAVNGLTQIKSVSQLSLGNIVFKAKTQSESGWSLPSKYYSSGDMNDYYHVGVVTGVNPLEITHCSSPSNPILRDKKIGKWKYVGKLKLIDYDGGDDPVISDKLGTIVLPAGATGSTVNMRNQASISSKLVARVPVGSQVTIEKDLGEWMYIHWNTNVGYMMSNYIEYADQEDDTGTDNQIVISAADYDRLEAAFKQRDAANEIIDSIIGRG